MLGVGKTALDLGTLIAVLAPLAIVVHYLTDALKDLTNRNWNGLLTRAVAFVGAFAVVVLGAHSSIDFGGGSASVLGSLSWADQILVALLIAATAGSVIATGLKTLNRSDTSTALTLLPSASTPSLAEQNAA